MKTYHTIYLSPHLDDAILSCGGHIYNQTQAGYAILIVTITAGIPDSTTLSTYAQDMHHGWDLATQTVTQRQQEDINACHLLGADYQHWPYLDCIYRQHPQTGQTLYNSDSDIFGSLHPTEFPLVTQLTTHIKQLPPHHQLCIPLSIGNHVDHQLTRLAAEAAYLPHTLHYYEDYPYAQAPNALTPLNLAPPAWQSQTYFLTPTALTAKTNAIAAYTSQIPTLFGNQTQMRSQLQTYTHQIGGERTWHHINSLPSGG